MKAVTAVILAMGLATVSLSYAQSGADVVKAKGCLNCHEMDKKKIGPAYKDVAAKYKDDKGAEAMLIGKLKEGKGHPKIQASDAELKAAVGYVLSAK
jgi:cytochrome c